MKKYSSKKIDLFVNVLTTMETTERLENFYKTKRKLMTDFQLYKKYVDEHGIDDQIIFIYVCGFCDVFSRYLNKKLNYSITYSSGIRDSLKLAVHSFCVHENEYYDINGRHTKESILENPTWDNITIEKIVDVEEHQKIWNCPKDHWLEYEKFVEYIFELWFKRIKNNERIIKLIEFL